MVSATQYPLIFMWEKWLKTMRKFFVLFLLLIGVGVGVWAAPKKTPAKKPLPVWKPATALLKQLAPQTELPFGTIRLPRGYEILSESGSIGFAGSGFGWHKKSAQHQDDHIIGIVQIPFEALGVKEMTLEESLSSWVKGSRRFYTNFRYLPAQKGIINGRTVLKTNWFGTNRKNGKKSQGLLVVYNNAADTYAIVSRHRSDQAAEKRITEATIYTLNIQSED